MKRLLIILIVLSQVFVSCKKMLDVNSTRLVSEENMWISMEDSRGALMGVYGLTKSALNDNNAHWIYGDVRSGQFSVPIRQDLKAVAKHDLNASFGVMNDLKSWRRWYAVINSANIFLERIHEVKEKDERYTNNNMVVDIAQARFLRAFAYFYMVRIWGDVPLIVSSKEGSFTDQPREDQSKVLAFVEQELIKAAQDLPFLYSSNDEQQQGNYYNESSSRWTGSLARKTTAYAILAHVAAWQSNYPDAAAYAKFVIDNAQKGGLGILSTGNMTDPNGFFYDKNNNQLLGFAHVYNHVEGSFTGHIEELTLAAPVVNKSIPDMYIPKEKILEIFNEPTDERFSADTLGNPVTEVYFRNFNGQYPIFSKVKCIMGGVTDPSFRFYSSATIITRLEDMYLLRAEALAVIGEQNGAIDLLNTIRERRGLNNYSAARNGELIEAIFQERNRELMGEGHRWYDLVRQYKIINDNSDLSKLIRDNGQYWPISTEVLTQNKLLTQNEYWK
ncbi:RagB/SusD family nutrient uptake outer membrane protein [Sphingobacterium endophyticum]|uniref:RagB/SusD family nutrient uptake outer membrane protein n=1 Tax=Sphingobacterium endophyticum TaxID=2546448 RepID=UPI0012E11474|nr:RagB/SusD family nutrient uptake outer membrane protein [Sphingobacterium endophyticum]